MLGTIKHVVVVVVSSFVRSVSELVSLLVNHSMSQSVSDFVCYGQTVGQSVNNSFIHCVSQPVSQSVSQSESQSASKSFIQSASKSYSQSVSPNFFGSQNPKINSYVHCRVLIFKTGLNLLVLNTNDSSIDDRISQFNEILKSVAELNLVVERSKTRKKTKKQNKKKPWYDNTCRQEKAAETCEQNESNNSSIIATRTFCSQKEIQKTSKQDV